MLSVVLGLVVAGFVAGHAAPAWAHHGDIPEGIDIPPTVFLPEGTDLALLDAADLYGWEPLGIVAGDDVRAYSLGTDRWAVWVCDYPGAGIGVTPTVATDFLASVVAPHYDWLSEGAYSMVFVPAGSVVGSDPQGCLDAVAGSAQPFTVNGAIVIADAQLGFGFGGPGLTCPSPCGAATPRTFPANSRFVFMGGESVVAVSPWPAPVASLVSHEIGHGIGWPHSYTGQTLVGGRIWEYDNPIDLMSGNSGADLFTTVTDSYATLAFNRYAAGWIEPAEVAVHTGGTTEVVLGATGSDGTEMVVIPLGEQGHLVSLDARVPSAHDPIPTSWEGVSVHTIDQRDNGACFSSVYGVCYGLDRRTAQNPSRPDSIAHVLGVGDTATISGVRLTIVGREGNGFRIRLDGGVAVSRFTDTGASPFVADIEWLADTGITRGCNPPTNDRFCPEDSVTRGQMAAFLSRAFGLTDSGNITFADTAGDVFRADIARLAAARITRGCNPPVNDRFCPEEPVTRGEMAAFLTRAFGLVDTDGVTFTDTVGSVFQSDIARLAAAGITRGCTPTRFCPNDPVTRGQMAAFLNRAEGYLP
ncbi:MAG: S-layer homology domain-containing protein [Acidimicrobiia bacterium]